MTFVFPRESLGAFPPALHPDYKSTVKRSPRRPLVMVPHTLCELTGPVYGHDSIRPGDDDLTKQHAGEPLGERIVVHGRVLDEDGRPVPDTLVEIWQAHARGRYIHQREQAPAPAGPNFNGAAGPALACPASPLRRPSGPITRSRSRRAITIGRPRPATIW